MSRQHLDRACKKKPNPPKASKPPKRHLSKTFKSNFNRVVKNNALKSQESKYNPKIDMNWCNLPMEMRLECVKRMDFKTRCRFRRTSHTEKSLVDSKKYQFEYFEIVYDYHWNTRVIAKKKFESRPIEVDVFNKDAPDVRCISAILKYAEVKNFQLSGDNFRGARVLPLLEQMEKFAPFGFKRVSVFCNSSIDFFMKHCPNLEKVDFCEEYLPFPFTEILKAPLLMNIKEFKFSRVRSADFLKFLKGLVQKWIDNDAGIGKSIQFSTKIYYWNPAISILAEKFSDRVIEKTDKEVRIRMNNNSTQILFRQVGVHHGEIHIGRRMRRVPREFCSCKVIPIDLPKSEYGNGDGWIQAVYEKNLKRHGELEKATEFDTEDKNIWGKGHCIQL